MDLKLLKELNELNEEIFNMKTENCHSEVLNDFFNNLCYDKKDIKSFNVVNDFTKLIQQHTEKVSNIALLLVNDINEVDNVSILKIKKELRQDLKEFLKRLISFTINEEKELSLIEDKNFSLEKYLNTDSIKENYDFILSKFNNINDSTDKELINKINQDICEILDQVEKFKKVFFEVNQNIL